MHCGAQCGAGKDVWGARMNGEGSWRNSETELALNFGLKRSIV